MDGLDACRRCGRLVDVRRLTDGVCYPGCEGRHMLSDERLRQIRVNDASRDSNQWWIGAIADQRYADRRDLLAEVDRLRAALRERDEPSADTARHAVKLLYRNHRGEVAVRTVVPRHLRFGLCEWHPGEQWLLDVWDVDKQAVRTFAMCDALAWGADTAGELAGLRTALAAADAENALLRQELDQAAGVQCAAVEAEREACAHVVERDEFVRPPMSDMHYGWDNLDIAAAIRARGATP